MTHSATVSSKGQVTLPKELRDRHHLLEGEVALILDVPEGVLIRHARASIRGLLKDDFSISTFERDLRRLRNEWSL